MKRAQITLTLLLCVAAAVAFAQDAARPELTMRQRGEMIFKALEAEPVDVAALRRALQDIGHVEATCRSGPLKKWADGARIIEGQIHLTETVGLNRAEGGAPPAEWIEKLTAAVKGGKRPVVLKLAFAAEPAVRARRDRILAEADRKVRDGLKQLAETHPQLKKTNWGTLEEALAGESPAGRISIWAAHYQGGKSGLKTPVAKEDRYNLFVLLRPLHWPVPGGEWRMDQMHTHLALMGQVFADAGDPELRAALKKLVADAVAPLERLNDAAAKGELPMEAPVEAEAQPTTRPTAFVPPVPAAVPDKQAPKPDKRTQARVKLLKAHPESFSLILQYNGPQDKPFYNLSLLGSQVQGQAREFWPMPQLTARQVEMIVDFLSGEGYLARARDITNARVALPKGPCYTLVVLVDAEGEGERLTLYEDLGWDLAMLQRLDGLRKVLDGDAAKAMDTLLGRLAGHRGQWQRAAALPADNRRPGR